MKFPDGQYSAQANSICENAIEKAGPIYNQHLEHFLELLDEANSLSEFSLLLRHNAADTDFLSSFSSVIYDGMLLMDGLGRTFIADKDLLFSQRQNVSPAFLKNDGVVFTFRDAGVFACKDDRVKISFDLTPEAAAQYMHEKSFWITGIENDELLKKIQNSLEAALREGKTWSDFSKEANALFDSMKVERLAPHRLQTVFRTNLFSAYSVAQLEQVSQMANRFPLWRYVAILDSATRPDHAALNGKIFEIGKGPYPPIDFNCRCSAQHLHEYEVQNGRLTPTPNVELPTTVIDFTDQGAFQRWLQKRKQELDGQIRIAVANASPVIEKKKESEQRRRAESLFEVELGPKLKRPVLHALEVLDTVLEVPEMPKIPLRRERGRSNYGKYVSNMFTGQPKEIAINAANDHIGMTTLHEFGHFFDHHGIGTPGVFTSASEDPILKEWRKAIEGSEAYKNLQAELARAQSFRMQAHTVYLLKWKELFARSYAQYIATRSGNSILLGELDIMRKKVGIDALRQWNDDDFKPIQSAFERLFSKLGFARK